MKNAICNGNGMDVTCDLTEVEEQFSVKTPVGEISVKRNIDENYPGVWIVVDGQELILVDYDAEEGTHFARVWTKKRDEEGNEPIIKVDLESEQ